MKTLLTLTLCLLLASTAHATTCYVAVSHTSTLNVRTQPSRHADILTEKQRGDELRATGNREGLWVEVYTDCYTIRYSEAQGEERIGPHNGWVLGTYLSEEKDYQPWTGVISAGGRVHLRESAGGRHLVWVQPGDEVTVLYPQSLDGETWYRVRTAEGTKGSVMAEFVGEAQ